MAKIRGIMHLSVLILPTVLVSPQEILGQTSIFRHTCEHLQDYAATAAVGLPRRVPQPLFQLHRSTRLSQRLNVIEVGLGERIMLTRMTDADWG